MFGYSQQVYAIDSCNCVSFRLDDIQDYYLNKAQMEIINTFQKNNASLTVGIIGNYFGNDTVLVDFLKEKLEHDTTLEIANHGWNHEDFTSFTKEEQSQLIKKTNEKTSKVLGVTPRGFIAPFNMINDDTLNALYENNLRYVSANVTQDIPPYEIKNKSFYHLPASAFTGDLNSDNTYWLGSSHKETFAQIQSSLIKHGFAVVTLHPQEYSKRHGLNFSNEIDEIQIRELELLVNEINNSGFEIVTMNEIPDQFVTQQTTPKWIHQIFAWHKSKKISTDEVINAINFLIKNKIIKINF